MKFNFAIIGETLGFVYESQYEFNSTDEAKAKGYEYLKEHKDEFREDEDYAVVSYYCSDEPCKTGRCYPTNTMCKSCKKMHYYFYQPKEKLKGEKL